MVGSSSQHSSSPLSSVQLATSAGLGKGPRERPLLRHSTLSRLHALIHCIQSLLRQRSQGFYTAISASRNQQGTSTRSNRGPRHLHAKAAIKPPKQTAPICAWFTAPAWAARSQIKLGSSLWCQRCRNTLIRVAELACLLKAHSPCALTCSDPFGQIAVAPYLQHSKRNHVSRQDTRESCGRIKENVLGIFNIPQLHQAVGGPRSSKSAHTAESSRKARTTRCGQSQAQVIKLGVEDCTCSTATCQNLACHGLLLLQDL